MIYYSHSEPLSRPTEFKISAHVIGTFKLTIRGLPGERCSLVFSARDADWFIADPFACRRVNNKKNNNNARCAWDFGFQGARTSAGTYFFASLWDFKVFATSNHDGRNNITVCSVVFPGTTHFFFRRTGSAAKKRSEKKNRNSLCLTLFSNNRTSLFISKY